MPNKLPLVDFFRYRNEKLLTNNIIEALDWELLIRQARRANLLGRVAFLLDESQQLQCVPEKPRLHLEGALRVCEANNRSVKWEVRQLYMVFHQADVEFILLKGAAYVINNVSASKGRLFADVDIMVHRDQLDKVELVLAQNGWMTSNVNSYDQQYYRKWMHELPPMRHLKRQTTLDVHHTIIPPTVSLKLDVNKLWEAAHVVDSYEGVYVLSLADMILHSATHLFYEGEFENGFRDITDLDLLLNEFINDKNRSWEQLIYRAQELGLLGPLTYAMRYCSRILATPIAPNVVEKLSKENIGSIKKLIMDFLFLRALLPNHFTCDDRWTGLSRWLLYLRSHWLKMPLYLLMPHLSRKAWMRLTGKDQH
jgi:putative nucleotidyltransferase-like protein